MNKPKQLIHTNYYMARFTIFQAVNNGSVFVTGYCF